MEQMDIINTVVDGVTEMDGLRGVINTVRPTNWKAVAIGVGGAAAMCGAAYGVAKAFKSDAVKKLVSPITNKFKKVNKPDVNDVEFVTEVNK